MCRRRELLNNFFSSKYLHILQTLHIFKSTPRGNPARDSYRNPWPPSKEKIYLGVMGGSDIGFAVSEDWIKLPHMVKPSWRCPHEGGLCHGLSATFRPTLLHSLEDSHATVWVSLESITVPARRDDTATEGSHTESGQPQPQLPFSQWSLAFDVDIQELEENPASSSDGNSASSDGNGKWKMIKIFMDFKSEQIFSVPFSVFSK